MRLLAALLLVLCCSGAQAQAHHDPLSAREVDQLRETAQQPQKRIDLLLDYTLDRVLAVDRLRAAGKLSSRDAAAMTALLADIATLIDELDDNLEMYNGHSEDLRRALRHVITAEDGFQKKLAALDTATSPAQKQLFAAALADATDSISASMQSARTMLANQLAKKGEEKDKEKRDRAEAQSARRAAQEAGQGDPERTPSGP